MMGHDRDLAIFCGNSQRGYTFDGEDDFRCGNKFEFHRGVLGVLFFFFRTLERVG